MTEAQAQQLVRMVCYGLSALGGAALMIAGLRLLLRPDGRRKRRTARILYFIRSDDAQAIQYPVVELGGAEGFCPAAVNAPAQWVKTHAGDEITVLCHPEDPTAVTLAPDKRPWGGAAVLLAGGALVVLRFALLLLSSLAA